MVRELAIADELEAHLKVHGFELDQGIQAINYLFRYQFAHTHDRRARKHYMVFKIAKLRPFLKDYFEVSGHRFVVDEDNGWAGLLPDIDVVPLPTMRVEETIVLLTLAAAWQEGIADNTMVAGGITQTTCDELYTCYQDLFCQKGRTALRPNQFGSILKKFKRRGLVRIDAFEDDPEDFEVDIRPIVSRLAGEDFIKRIQNWASSEEERSDQYPPESDGQINNGHPFTESLENDDSGADA